jgi:hypothetical protein
MYRLLLIALLLGLVIFQIQGEKIPLNDGAGIVGVELRTVSEGFLEHFDDEGYEAFLVQRILPFALLNMTFELFGFDMDPESFLHGILIFNFLALLLGIYWYLRIVKKLRSSAKMEVLGFVLMFGSFLVLKISWYEPFSPALFAYILGIGQVNYFIRYEKTKLFLVSLLGGFVWPTLFPVGMILIFMPNDKLVFKESERNFRVKYILPGLVLTAAMALFAVLFPERVFEGANLFEWLISLIALFIVITLGVNHSGIDWGKSLKLVQKKFKAERLTYLILSIGSYFLVIALLAVGKPSLSIKDFVFGILAYPVSKPLLFLISHFSFFGILIPLSIIFFSRISREAGKMGLGFSFLFILMMLFSLYGEAIWLAGFAPFMVLLILKGLRRYTLVAKDIWLIGFLNLMLSRFWYKINVEGLSESLSSQPNSFPAQRYFQHFGLTQSMPAYIIFLLVLVMMLLIIYYGKKRYAKAPDNI